MKYVFLGLAIVLEVVGTSFLNASNGFSRIAPTLTAIVSVVVFKQKLDLAAVMGMALIGAGVVVMSLFSKSTVH